MTLLPFPSSSLLRAASAFGYRRWRGRGQRYGLADVSYWTKEKLYFGRTLAHPVAVAWHPMAIPVRVARRAWAIGVFSVRYSTNDTVAHLICVPSLGAVNRYLALAYGQAR